MKKSILVFLCLFAITNLFAEQYGDFTYEIYDNKITITGLNSNPTSVSIPAEINRIPVTSLAVSAFLWCDSLTSITIPDSVTSIGKDAFNKCDSLKSIIIEDDKGFPYKYVVENELPFQFKPDYSWLE